MINQESERSKTSLSLETAVPPDVTILQTQETCVLLFPALYQEHKDLARALCSVWNGGRAIEGYILSSRLCLQSEFEEMLCCATA